MKYEHQRLENDSPAPLGLRPSMPFTLQAPNGSLRTFNAQVAVVGLLIEGDDPSEIQPVNFFYGSVEELVWLHNYLTEKIEQELNGEGRNE